MSQQINCPECGELNKIGENFCHNCGTQLKLIETKEPQPSPTQQPQTTVQDQYPTLILKPKQPKKTSGKVIILSCITILIMFGIAVGILFMIAHFITS